MIASKGWLALPALIGVLAIAEVLRNSGYYHSDELIVMLRCRDRPWQDLPWSSPFDLTSTFYRPLGWNYLVAVMASLGATPRAVHLVDLVTHSLCALCVYRLARGMGVSRAASAAGGLAFACAPAALPAVCWAACAYDRLWLLFALVGVTACWESRHESRVAGRRIVIVTGATIAALMCKETAVIVVPVLIVTLLSAGHGWRRLVVVMPSFVVWCAYLIVRVPILMGLALNDHGPSSYGVGLKASDLLRNALAYWAFPFQLGCHEMARLWLPAAMTWSVLAAICHCCLGAIGTAVQPKTLLRYPCGYFAPLLPVMLLGKVEEQYLYASSVALALLVAMVVRHARRPVLVVGSTVFCAVLALQSLAIARRFHHEGTRQNELIAQLTGPAAASRPSFPRGGRLVVRCEEGPYLWTLQRLADALPWLLETPETKVTVVPNDGRSDAVADAVVTRDGVVKFLR